jgi:hypothetical protein
MHKLLLCVYFVAATIAVPAAALAWDANAYWWDPAEGAPGQPYDVLPGAGGIIATGGASDHNITCADCHVKAAGQIDSKFAFNPALVGGAYSPGKTYQVTASLLYEHLGLSGCGPYVNGNVNNFAATFEDANGNVVGTLASDGNTSGASCQTKLPGQVTGSTITYGDCHAVTSTSEKDRQSWTFSWTAPAKGAGAVTLYFGMVDGDCMMDSLNDDVKVGTVKLNEGLASLSPPPGKDGNRAVAMVGLYPGLAIVAAVARARRRRSRSAP